MKDIFFKTIAFVRELELNLINFEKLDVIDFFEVA